MTIDVSISHIYSSPEHNYFTREKFDVGDAPSYDLKSTLLVEGKGIKEDRFELSTFPITFMSEEVGRDVCRELDLEYKPELFRRNIVTKGINLSQLIGKKFIIGSVEFEGLEHCAPCTWMNAVMKKGAYRAMSRRGGLRAKVLRGGLLKTGDNTLITKTNFDLLDPCTRILKPKLP